MEAHADDEWRDPDNAIDDVCYMRPKDLSQRIALANVFAERCKIDPDRIVVDSMDNAVELAYEARPEKLVVVKDGRIVFKSGIGPYQYSTKKCAEHWSNISGPFMVSQYLFAVRRRLTSFLENELSPKLKLTTSELVHSSLPMGCDLATMFFLATAATVGVATGIIVVLRRR